MTRYAFKEGLVVFRGFKDADPQAIGDALAEITANLGGQLTPEATLETAKKPTHPLHRHFTWNKDEAAKSWNLQEARAIIRSIVITGGPRNKDPVPAYISIATKEDGTAYHAHAEVVGSVRLQIAVLDKAEADLVAWQRRYRELADICELVDQLREKLRGKRSKAARPSQPSA